ncbi:SRPBCC family protein [Prescottella agglutinans]|uniref:SRPBCC family protein n=1 Tax=Prescottella agglutinans TaxID=1644129 RepID=A0A438BJ58_9NOCA|nr:SRPBCC family protein [Prescottella agglutinans]RVW10917.1 SRPBCC family protein [Prescottella agglutinans]
MSTTVVVEQSRAIPITLQRAFDLTLPIPLTAIFSRRYGLLPPIKRVRGQDGIWGHVGQSRTVVTTDRGTMRELLTEIDAPHSFSYRLSNITGPLRPLVDSIDGCWEFTPKGTGTLITWRWVLHPKALGRPVMPLVVSMWRGYARQALELLSEQLLAPDSAERTPGV